MQEELAYQDHVQSTMERLTDEPFIEPENEPEDHHEADVHKQQTEVYQKQPVWSDRNRLSPVMKKKLRTSLSISLKIILRK
ncbi:hypothetical protein BSAF29S_00955 [Bacillus safensis subsp. safensis]